MIGVEIEFPGREIVRDAMEEGLLINCTHDVVLRALPPYTLTEADVDRALKVLTKVFKKAKPPIPQPLPSPSEPAGAAFRER
jgi:acetylornithine/succinyldiaminopimelate/putrescine aminotransferase